MCVRAFLSVSRSTEWNQNLKTIWLLSTQRDLSFSRLHTCIKYFNALSILRHFFNIFLRTLEGFSLKSLFLNGGPTSCWLLVEAELPVWILATEIFNWWLLFARLTKTNWTYLCTTQDTVINATAYMHMMEKELLYRTLNYCFLPAHKINDNERWKGENSK